jgi:DNA/RNA endonuclease G (NUC1)
MIGRDAMHPSQRKGRKARDHKIGIHRGHLIAAQYRPTINEITFVFTNAIPQFGAIISGQFAISSLNVGVLFQGKSEVQQT